MNNPLSDGKPEHHLAFTILLYAFAYAIITIYNKYP